MILLSPMSPYVTAYHDIFYYQPWPDAGVWATPSATPSSRLALGLWLIVRYEDSFAEQV